MENHKLFKSEIGSLGICLRSRRVQSLYVKDPKIKILARVASGDQDYLRDIAYIEQRVDIDHISKESELLGGPQHRHLGQWQVGHPKRQDQTER